MADVEQKQAHYDQLCRQVAAGEQSLKSAPLLSEPLKQRLNVLEEQQLKLEERKVRGEGGEREDAGGEGRGERCGGASGERRGRRGKREERGERRAEREEGGCEEGLGFGVWCLVFWGQWFAQSECLGV
eukprot:299987-Rhodomonas_salina.1